ncbi:SAF domain-containing protein [Paenibacillus terreus]|uniref:SAF domain-containing protein n=1 Tax=Paenibacillus terreus TaxID=1387834 RepID=UPI0035CCF2CA
MSRVRLRQKQIVLSGAVGAVTMLIICLTIGVLLFKNFQTDYSQEIAELEQELADTQQILNQEMKQVPVVVKDHKAGDALAETDIQLVNMPVASVPKNVLNKEDVVGKYTKIDLPKNTPITGSMLFENGVTPNDLRNQEFKLIQLPTKLDPNQFVDVRIKFPTGEDYIVLSKKKVKDLANGLVSYEMDEQEILMMSSAIVDAYINDATIYALSYVDPYMQDKAIVTYPPKDEVKQLIKSDPNIVKVATEQLESKKRTVLEMNLSEMSEQDRLKYNAGMGINNGGTTSSPSSEGTGTSYTSDLPPVKDGMVTDPNAYVEAQESSSSPQVVNPPSEAAADQVPPPEEPESAKEPVTPEKGGDSNIYGELPKDSVNP